MPAVPLSTPLIHSLIRGLLLGMGAAIPLGPVNVEIARRTIRGGFLPGAALGVGAVSVDVTYAAICCFGFNPLLRHPWINNAVAVAGVVLLAYLGFLCLRGAWRALQRIDAATETSPTSASAKPVVFRGYLVGLAMTFTNPMTLMFWFVGASSVASAGHSGSGGGMVPLCAGVFVATLLWVIFFAGTLSRVGSFHRGKWMALADAVGGVTLIGFAITVFLRSVVPLL